MIRKTVLLPTLLASVSIVGVALSLGPETTIPSDVQPEVMAHFSDAMTPGLFDTETANLSARLAVRADTRPQMDPLRVAATSGPLDMLPAVSRVTASPKPVIAPQVPPKTLTDQTGPDPDRADAIDQMRAVAEERSGDLPSQLDIILKAHDATKRDAAPSAPLPVVATASQSRPLSKPLDLGATLVSADAADETPTTFQTAQAVVDQGSVKRVPLSRPWATVQTAAADSSPPAEPTQTPMPVASKSEAETEPAEPGKMKPFSTEHFQMLLKHAHKVPPSNVACVAELQLIADRTQIYFETGSSALDQRATSAARLIAAKAQSCPQAHVSIVGFTDPTGPKDVNLKISWKRANSVFGAIQNAGFSMSNIVASSHMEDHPEECLHYEGVDRRVIFSVREKIEGL